jgi:TPR repeat protein
LYRLSAAQGHARAQFNLGAMYSNGQGIRQDYAEAVKWYRLSAAQGHVNAQTNLGARYVNGQGVVQNNVRAYMWFSLVAESADADANAVKNRDLIAKRMTPQQIVQAQQMARDCQQRNFKGCE